jgi:hypothetical protein
MKKLKLNSEILSKMKLDLSRIFKDDEHVNEEILIQKERTDRVISNILNGKVEDKYIKDDIIKIIHTIMDLFVYEVLSSKLYNRNIEINKKLLRECMYNFFDVLEENLGKLFKNSYTYMMITEGEDYEIVKSMYYKKEEDKFIEETENLRRIRKQFAGFLKKLYDENKEYSYEIDEDKLYFKTFKLWYDAILKVNNRKNNIEGIVEYLVSKKQYLREKRNINQNMAKKIRENKEYVDYKFDYIKIMEKGFEILDRESIRTIERAISTLIENERIDSSKAEPGDIRSRAINLNNSYMIFKAQNNDFNNILVFFHEFRTYSGKNNYK